MKNKKLWVAGACITVLLLRLGWSLTHPNLMSAKVVHQDNLVSCMLNQNAYAGEGGYDLAFVSVNQHSISPIQLVQYNQDGTVSNHSIYGVIKGAFTEGSTSSAISYSINMGRYAALDGTITLGSQRDPVFDTEMFCTDCENAILSIIPDNDLFLFDFKEHTIYDLCKENYDFLVRNYRVETKANKDGTIDITVEDYCRRPGY